ncbi:hypothetical protein DL93DRAFT_1114836 [Clavulina sp. PMI_390]|nr:hypothetical protein DL93DRAFT_1114836 [Clavulina sp. PMI_390]
MSDVASYFPMEMTSCVFLAGLESFGDDYWANDRMGAALIRYLLTITSVSSLWRSIAISTPLLWVKIVIGYRGPKGFWAKRATAEHVLARVLAYLRRSKQTPLEVTLYALPHYIGEIPTGFVSVWQSSVEKELYRSRAIRLLNVAPCARVIFPLPGPFPLCEQMVIQFDTYEQPKTCILGPQDIPRVRSLVTGFCEPRILSVFPFRQFVHLKLEREIWTCSDYRALLPMVSSALSLIDLNVQGPECSMTEALEPIVLPKLRNFHACGPEILKIIKAPNLYRLECSEEAVAGLNQLSNSSLTHMVLHDPWLRDVQAWPPSFYPSLQVLEMRGCSPDALDVILGRLSTSRGQDHFPALNTLRLCPHLGRMPVIPTSSIPELRSIMEQRSPLRLQCLAGEFTASSISEVGDQEFSDLILGGTFTKGGELHAGLDS